MERAGYAVGLCISMLVGCVLQAPDYSATRFACPAPSGACPAGMECVDGVCLSPTSDDSDAGLRPMDDAGAADAAPSGLLIDDFDRPDGPTIGNGWLEKRPGAFALQDGRLIHPENGIRYPDRLLYRPVGEDVLDVETTIEIVFSSVDPFDGRPQLHGRVQRDDIDEPGSVTGYIVFLDGGPSLTITRQLAGKFSAEVSRSLSGPLEVGARYRLRMRITGTSPVRVEGALEVENGNEWLRHTSLAFTDDGSSRIQTAGSVAISGHQDGDDYSYDDFVRQAL